MSRSIRRKLACEYLEQRQLLAGDISVMLAGGNLLLHGDGENNNLAVVQSGGEITIDSFGIIPSLLPHISVEGTGDGTFDYYSFTVSNAGDRGIFDIDFENFDTMLFLYDDSGNLLAQNDDSALDPGSNSSLASYLEFVFPEAGTYIIGVGEFFSQDEGGQIVGNPPDEGHVYTLHISLENHALNPGGEDPVAEVEPNDPPALAQNVDDAGWNQEPSEGASSLNGGFLPIIFDASRVRDVRITTIGGNDTVTVRGLELDGGVRATLGQGDDRFSAVDLAIESLSVHSGNGIDDVRLTGSSTSDPSHIRRDVDIHAGQEDDFVLLSAVDIGGNLRVNGSEGNDDIRVQNALVAKDTTIDAGPDDDIVVFFSLFSASEYDGDVTIRTGPGNDSVVLQAIFAALDIAGDLSIDLGPGDDIARVGFTILGSMEIGGNLLVNAGPGDDGVSVQTFEEDAVTIVGDVRLRGGPGDDGPANDFVLSDLVAVLGETFIEDFEALAVA